METKLVLPSVDWKYIHSGDIVYVSGKLYVARDQAHKLLVSEIKEKGETPFPLKETQSTTWGRLLQRRGWL